jgi:dienelactone hydrolase
MALTETTLDYDIDGTTYEGLLVVDDSRPGPRPGVLVAHAWAGRTDFEDSKARWLAERGYAALAIDLYGKGVRGSNNDENAALMTPLVEDRPMLQARLAANLAVLREQDAVDAARCAGIGFCFGGLCMLDLARSGTAMAGVVSVHGLFMPAPNTAGTPITASVLCLHGYDDPMAPPQSLLDLARELSDAGADWQVHAYGGTMHAFTNPQANDPDFGTVYSERASARAHAAIEAFLAELFPG